MEKLVATGKVKAIGVCNYSVPFLKQLLAEATIVPAVNQIENHPSLPQQEVVDFCKEKGIHITAYSPLGSTGGPLMTEPVILEVAKTHSVSPATILLSYHSKIQYPFICLIHSNLYSCSWKFGFGKVCHPGQNQVQHGDSQAHWYGYEASN